MEPPPEQEECMTMSIDDLTAAYFSATTPHPRPLLISSIALRCRARLAERSAREQLLRNADLLERYAARLSWSYDKAWFKAADEAGILVPHRFRNQDTVLTTDAGSLLVESLRVPFALQVQQFEIRDVPERYLTTAKMKAAPVLARLTAAEHLPGRWEVLDVEVDADHRRKGMASRLYGALCLFNRTRIISPSGWLSADAMAMWAKWKPDCRRNFVPAPGAPRFFVSAKQLMYLRAALAGAAMESAEPAASRSLH